LSVSEATWGYFHDVRSRFLDALVWGKQVLQGEMLEMSLSLLKMEFECLILRVV
jgi:hypothetical protein